MYELSKEIDKVMPQLIYKELWENCDEKIKRLAVKYLDYHFGYNGGDTTGYDKYVLPKAVLLFEYYHDMDKVKEAYLKQNDGAKYVKIDYIKFLPEELSSLIENKKLYSDNMFLILLAY